jgi:hypothetical protein
LETLIRFGKVLCGNELGKAISCEEILLVLMIRRVIDVKANIVGCLWNVEMSYIFSSSLFLQDSVNELRPGSFPSLDSMRPSAAIHRTIETL